MKVWSYGKDVNIELGQKVFIGHCGSGLSVCGEYGTFTRTTKKQLVFKTDSGVEVKTKIDNLGVIVGKGKDSDLFVSVNVKEGEFTYSPVTL